MKNILTSIFLALAVLVPVVNYAVLPAVIPTSQHFPQISKQALDEAPNQSLTPTVVVPAVEAARPTPSPVRHSRTANVFVDGKDFKQVVDSKDFKEVVEPTPIPEAIVLPPPPIFEFPPVHVISP